MSRFDLAGRRAVVTGGAGGIGRGLAAALHEAGCELAILGRSETVLDAAAELRTTTRPVHGIQVDLTDRLALGEAVDAAVSGLGGIDILVNCHGSAHVHDSVEYPTEDWDTEIETNLTSVFLLCRNVGSRMIDQGQGKVINIASMLSYFGGLRAPAYAAAKGGIVQLTKALSNEWAGQGVCVNAIAPGYVRTKLNVHVWKDPDLAERTASRIPKGRWGEPSDLAGTVVFLASPASDYVTGVTIPVDGGYLAR